MCRCKKKVFTANVHSLEVRSNISINNGNPAGGEGASRGYHNAPNEIHMFT